MREPNHLTDEDPKILGSAAEAWRFLEREGGLDPAFYDAAIVTELRRAVGLASDEDVAEGLIRKSVGIEDFLVAFFAVVEPYARMMTDLLNLFTQAGARSSDHNLRLEFDFGRQDLKLGFDLHQFRDWIAIWERLPRSVSLPQWTYHALWELFRILLVERREARIDHRLMGADGTGAQDWVREYMEGRWPRVILPAPESGEPALDRVLLQAWRLWSSVVQESMHISRDRQQLREFRLQPEREAESEVIWTPRFLSSLDSDHWAASLAAGLYGTAEVAQRMTPEARSEFVRTKVSALDELFAHQPTVTIETEIWQQALKDFLNLPIWKRRHEIYSAWVWTQIMTALSDFACHIHQQDGVIHFSFAGSHLATFPRFEPELHVWAELRSPLAEKAWGKSRKNKIQPDYTLIQSPITSRNSAVLVVECKQYRVASTKNFYDALVDYAHGRPNAQVVLVNYGPAPAEILEHSPEDIRHRLTLIGEMRPGGKGVAPFHESVRDVVARRCNSETVASVTGTGVSATPLFTKLVLKWGEQPQDLDLHLIAVRGNAETEIYFGNQGSLSREPWAELDTDARHAFGTETIKIGQLSGTYRCFIHNYSNDAPLAGSGANLLIDQERGSLALTCPQEGNGRFWHVFELDAATGSLKIVNTLSDSKTR